MTQDQQLKAYTLVNDAEWTQAHIASHLKLSQGQIQYVLFHWIIF